MYLFLICQAKGFFLCPYNLHVNCRPSSLTIPLGNLNPQDSGHKWEDKLGNWKRERSDPISSKQVAREFQSQCWIRCWASTRLDIALGPVSQQCHSNYFIASLSVFYTILFVVFHAFWAWNIFSWVFLFPNEIVHVALKSFEWTRRELWCGRKEARVRGREGSQRSPPALKRDGDDAARNPKQEEELGWEAGKDTKHPLNPASFLRAEKTTFLAGHSGSCL